MRDSIGKPGNRHGAGNRLAASGLSGNGPTLHRDTLDNIAGHPTPAAIVDLGGLGIGVPGQVLHVF